MSQLKVLIKGIALCHFDPAIRNWKVFVPKIEEDHVFRVSVIKKETAVPDQVIFSDTVDVGSRIVLSNDTLPLTGDFVPIFLEDNFDLSEFHGEAIPLVDDINKYAAFITLQGFPPLRSLLAFDSPLRSYKLLKVKPDGTKEDKGESSCRDIIFTMAQPRNVSNTSILINGNKIIDKPHSSRISYEVVFDNDCDRIHNPTAASGDPDFKYYYNIIDKGKLNDPCHFELEPIPEKCEVAGCGSGIASSIEIGENLIAHLK